MGKKIVISFPGGRGYEIPVLYFGAKYYEDIVFIAKSIGTIVACQIKEKYHIPATLILFTPLNETLPYIHSKNDIKLVAVGDKDRYIDVEMLQKVCDNGRVLCHIEHGVGHRMEVLGDLDKNLDIISNVIKYFD